MEMNGNSFVNLRADVAGIRDKKREDLMYFLFQYIIN